MRKQVTDVWFTTFNESFGLSVENSPSLQLLKDLPEKESRERERAAAKLKLFKRLLAGFSGSESELLTSQEDAEEVISCCLCVLEVIYSIRFSVSCSVKLCHMREGGALLEIENIPGLCAADKPQGKRWKWVKKRQKNEGTITVLCNAPYISVVIAFLEKCFEAEVSKRKSSGTEEERSNEQEAQWDERKPHVIVWLVANCLYNMGELEYAKQYVGDCQKGEKNEVFDSICHLWGIPWDVWGKKLDDLLPL